MTSPPSTAPITLERPADGTPLPPTHPDFVPFGSRLLKDPSDVYSHNAWDHVTPPPEWEIQARETLEVQKQGMVGDKMKWAYNSKPSLYWNRFYDINKDKFFKDRNWLRLEFPELLACAEEDAGPKLVVEIGCGAGNTVFPLLAKNENPQLVVHACDYAPSAVELVKSNPNYPVPPHGKGRLFSSVWDLTCPPVRADDASSSTPPTESSHDEPPREPRRNSLPEGIEEGTVDVAVMIYVMSALHPGEWARAVANAWKVSRENVLLIETPFLHRS
jgi:tRNAThr (cytosine32-N3)-methyltransferase